MNDAGQTPLLPVFAVIPPPANLPLPKSLVMDGNLANNWKQSKKVEEYEIAGI